MLAQPIVAPSEMAPCHFLSDGRAAMRTSPFWLQSILGFLLTVWGCSGAKPPSQPPGQLLLWFAFAFKAVFPALKPLNAGSISVISSVGTALPSGEHRKAPINSGLKMPFLIFRYPLTSFPVDKISNSHYKIFLWILFSLLLSSFNLLTCVL